MIVKAIDHITTVFATCSFSNFINPLKQHRDT